MVARVLKLQLSYIVKSAVKRDELYCDNGY